MSIDVLSEALPYYACPVPSWIYLVLGRDVSANVIPHAELLFTRQIEMNDTLVGPVTFYTLMPSYNSLLLYIVLRRPIKSTSKESYLDLGVPVSGESSGALPHHE